MPIYGGVKLAMKHCTSNTFINNNNNKKHNRNVRIHLETIQRDWGMTAEDLPG